MNLYEKFDYKEFKKDMQQRGHEVYKNGQYIKIIPNNNYKGYNKGFLHANEVIEGYECNLAFVAMDHFNTWIYYVKYKIIK